MFSLAFCAWTRDCDEQAVKPTSVTIFPWWRNISNPEDMPLTGENLFRFEVNFRSTLNLFYQQLIVYNDMHTFLC